MTQSTEELLELYHTKRTARLALNKKADLLEQEEKVIADQILARTKTSGTIGRFVLTVKDEEVPSIEDPIAFLAHVKATGEVDLLEKRLAKGAANLRLKDGKTIPGVRVDTKTTMKVEQNGQD